MRMIVIGLAAVLLAGCGSGLVQIDEGNGAGPETGAAGDPSKPAGQGGPAAPGAPAPTPGVGRSSREATIAECVTDLGRSLPRGTNVPALCTCAVDRMIARMPQRDAVRQCATEQNVRVPGL